MLSTLLLLAATTPLPQGHLQGPSAHVRVAAPVRSDVFELQLAAEGFDVLFGATPDQTGPPWSVELIVLPAEHAALVARGLTIEVIAKGRPFADILAEQSAARGVPSGYLDNAGILAELNSLAASYPALAQVVDLTTTYGTPATVEGRHLYALKIWTTSAWRRTSPPSSWSPPTTVVRW